MDRRNVAIIAVKFHVQCQHSRVNSSNRREVYSVFLCVLGGHFASTSRILLVLRSAGTTCQQTEPPLDVP